MKRRIFLPILALFIFLGYVAFVESSVAKPILTKYAFTSFQGQAVSFERKSYLDLIRSELSKYQYTEVPMEQADVGIIFGYAIGSGRQKTISTTGHQTMSITRYPVELWLRIIEKASLGNEKFKVVYEAIVKSESESNQPAEVMPVMIKGLFKEFPGNSGSNRKETVPASASK